MIGLDAIRCAQESFETDLFLFGVDRRPFDADPVVEKALRQHLRWVCLELELSTNKLSVDQRHSSLKPAFARQIFAIQGRIEERGRGSKPFGVDPKPRAADQGYLRGVVCANAAEANRSRFAIEPERSARFIVPSHADCGLQRVSFNVARIWAFCLLERAMGGT